MAIDNGFFLAKFSSVDDYEHVKYDGPWQIFNHYLTVRQWQPNFDPAQDSLQSLLVWVRIPCLPNEYYEYSFLMRLGGMIGKPIKIKEEMGKVSRGRYTRICVEVDLAKPLVCFGCGVYGHRRETCPSKQHGSVRQHRETQRTLIAAKHPQGQNVTQEGNKEPLVNPEVVEDFGPWMLPTRKLRRNQGKVDDRVREGRFLERKDSKGRGRSGYGKRHQIGQESRFNILNEDSERSADQILNEEGQVGVDPELRRTDSGKATQSGNKGRKPNVQVQDPGPSSIVLEPSMDFDNSKVATRQKT